MGFNSINKVEVVETKKWNERSSINHAIWSRFDNNEQYNLQKKMKEQNKRQNNKNDIHTLRRQVAEQAATEARNKIELHKLGRQVAEQVAIEARNKIELHK